jgi:hypothetical protein
MKTFGVWAVAALLPLIAAQDNSAAGTWKLNLSQSKFSPGPPPKGATLIIEAQNNSVKAKYEETEGDDSRAGYEYNATVDDGKDYPLSGSPRPDRLGGAETVLLRSSGSSAYSGQFKKSGQIVMTNRMVVSKDGKTLTLKANGADAKGQPISAVLVWDKQ